DPTLPIQVIRRDVFRGRGVIIAPILQAVSFLSSARVVIDPKRNVLLRIVKIVNRQRDVLHVVAARHTADSFACRLNRWEEQRYQYADDGDHDKQFDERETAATQSSNECWGVDVHDLENPAD